MNIQSNFRNGFSRVGTLRQVDDGFPEISRAHPNAPSHGPDLTPSSTSSLATRAAAPVAEGATMPAASTISASEPAGTFGGTAAVALHAQMGFVPTWPLLHRIYNCALACALILLTLPLGLVISALLLVTQGTSIFYRGVRVGRDGDLFNIVKFRTLDSARAAELTRDRVLPEGTDIETPLGHFLRETRLDELPQLINVVMGDMNFCGPRPVRPEIASELEGVIPGYAERFTVKPGLLGPTQACMNHGASKQIRARFNAKFLRNPVCYRCELGLITLVGACVFSRAGAKLWSVAKRVLRPSQVEAKAARRAERLRVQVEDSAGNLTTVTSLEDERIVTRDPVAEGPARLMMTLPDGRKRHARVTLEATGDGQATRTATFRAEGDYAVHVLTRYFFERVVVPHRSRIPLLSRSIGLRSSISRALSAFWRAIPRTPVP